MKIELLVQERLSLQILFPEKSNIVEQTYVRDISKKIQLEQQEIDDLGFKIDKDSGTCQWDSKKDNGKEIEFTAKELSFLQDRIKIIDEKKEITQVLLPLCILIMGV